MKVREITVCGLMTALMCVCAWITIPSAVPFTLQTLGVFAALLLLGRRSIYAVGAYLFMGAVGLPVFSGFRGGLGMLLGPTGGYLWGFLCMSAVYTAIVKERSGVLRQAAALSAGLLSCYVLGTAQYIFVMGMPFSLKSICSAAGVCVLPFVLPDFLKMAAAICISKSIAKIKYP